ncbi:MAG: hypothetical protein Q9187_006577 [Circinaria calcarea]
MTQLDPILSRLGLAQYLPTFLNEGFDTWETVLDITESDLDSLNVKLGHRRRLQREIANARGLSFDRPIASPIRGTSSEDIHPFEGGETPDSKKCESDKSSGNGRKRKYRRHPKPDENAPERPPSAYVIFSNKVREDLKPQNLSFTEIAKRVGECWQVLVAEEKELYDSQASLAKEKYNSELSKYKKTTEYRDYSLYLADFKTKNAPSKADGKRPKLDTERKRVSSESVGCHPGHQPSGMRLVGYESQKLEYFSYAGNQKPIDSQTSPLTMPLPTITGGPLTVLDSPSPGSLTPTPPAASLVLEASPGIDTETPPSGVMEGVVYREAVAPRVPSLPRIIPLEDKETLLMQGQLPPLAIETAALRPAASPQFNARRSVSAHASFLTHDASQSSVSSRSSNFSTPSTSLSPITPITPVEEIRSKRALPLPLAPPLTSALTSQFADQNQEHLYSANPIQSNQVFNPSSSQTSQHPSSLSTDIPHERRSLMNLSLKDVAIPLHPHYRSQSRELRDAGQTGSHRPLERTYRPSPKNSQSLPFPVYGQGHRALLRQEEEEDGVKPVIGPPIDPLSVLVYAGRLIDRESQKRP